MIRTTGCVVVCSLMLASNVFAQHTIGGCSIFPANNIWNQPIDTLPVRSDSATLINTIGASRGLHPDFGAGLWQGGPMGIPFVTVTGSQTKYPTTFTWPDESDPGPYAVPLNAPIEGGSNATGDRHAIALDTTNCVLYELYNSYPGSNSWRADSGAIFDLKSNTLRPNTWTSADAAGLPILPGLITYDEIAAGEIRHAIRFTVQQTRNQAVWPARHVASSLSGSQYPRMGERFRLKASFDVTPYPNEVQIILRAMKKYGLIVADNGSSWYISGAPDDRWNNDNLARLSSVVGSNFEAVDATSLMVDPNSGATTGSGGGGGTGSKNKILSRNDYDRDAKSDLVIYRPGNWFVKQSHTGFSSTALVYQWGALGDIPLSGDFDGDGTPDIAVYRQSGEWFIRNSSNNYAIGAGNWYFQWGATGDIPLIGDFDGDGKTDITVYRPSSGQWFIRSSSQNYTIGAGAWYYQWGALGDVPLIGDFDGDGRTDVSVYRTASGEWFIRRSSQGYSTASMAYYQWGATGDTPVVGDFDGDGKSDVAVFRAASGEWFIRHSSQNFSATAMSWFQWGITGDKPMVGDFDGDGRAEISVYRPGTGYWYVRYSSKGYSTSTAGGYQWGATGDTPLPTN